MKTAIVAGLALVFGIGVGTSTAAGDEAPEPTPQIVEVPGPTQTIEVEVPGPTQTIEIEREVEVEVIPQSCTDEFNQLADSHLIVLGNYLDILKDYSDYPDENLTEFGVRVEQTLSRHADEHVEPPVIDYYACER